MDTKAAQADGTSARTNGVGTGVTGRTAEALLHMVPWVERFQFSICFNSCLRRRRRQTSVMTQIEVGMILRYAFFLNSDDLVVQHRPKLQ